MRDEQIEAVRKACIAANPDIKILFQEPNIYESGAIRLADMLLAVGDAWRKDLDVAMQSLPRYRAALNRNIVEVIKRWHLRADDLTQQSDETIEFLAGLLANK